MFPPRTTVRSFVSCALACGLLAITASGAAAGSLQDARADDPASNPAETTSRLDPRSADARDAANLERIARATEDYYQSFGEPGPVPVPPFVSPAPASPPPADDMPWALIAGIAAALAAVTASGALVLRRRHTAGPAT